MRLLRRAPRSQPTAQPTIFYGSETLEVVGESQYQDTLWQIVGGFRRDPVRHPCQAVLLPEPDNPYDRNAIRVLVDWDLVGYLSREDAAVYLPGLQRLIATCDTGSVALEGQIVGGGPRGDGIGFLGIFLDHHPERIERGDMLMWADDLGFGREGLDEAVWLAAGQPKKCLAPSPDGAVRCVPCKQATIAFAYAHGRIGFDELLEWAHEAGLDREQTDEVVLRSAREAHGYAGAAPCACVGAG